MKGKITFSGRICNFELITRKDLIERGYKYMEKVSGVFYKDYEVNFDVPKFNVIIEYNGKQHYYDGWFFKENGFEKQQERDMALRQYCKEHKIKLVEIPFYEMGNIEDILTKELKIHKNKS